MGENLAPIVLFVYNRLKHTKKTIDALQNNYLAENSELFIFSDGPQKDEDIVKVKEVRDYIHQVKGFKQVHVKEREKNYGIEQSIVLGVNEIISQYGKVIVLEDDLVTDVNFLLYMNRGLDKYQKNLKVYSISGYSYLKEGVESGDTYFLKICTSWSWATWKDRWQKYDVDCKDWEMLKVDRRRRREFDYDYSYPFYNLLKRELKDKTISAWDIKWYWTIFKNEGLTLFPPKSLVNNEGFDGSGVHCSKNQKGYERSIYNDIQREWEFSDDVFEQQIIRKQIAKSIWKQTTFIDKIQIIRDFLE